MTLLSSDPAHLAAVGGGDPVPVPRPIPVGGIPLRPWTGILFGTPFVALGGFLAWQALRMWRGEEVPEAHVPWFVLAAVGALFLGAGLLVAGAGVARLVAAARARRRGASLPGQPWLADFPWDRLGGRDRSPMELGAALAMASAFVVFAGVFGWVGFQGDGGFVFKLAAVLIAVAAAAIVAHAARLAWRRLRWGRSRLRFGDFPVAPGTTATLILDDLAPRARAVPLRATLRCVQQRWETRQVARNRRDVSIAHYALWSETRELPPGTRSVAFAIPAEAPGCELGRRPARYWELELEAEVPGVDYRASFLVPVYATPAGGR